MISVYRVFQMIFGLIASIFILFFILQYTSSYEDIQQLSHSAIILGNFNKVAGDVYLTNNPIDFNDFSYFDLGACFTLFNLPDDPVIRCNDIEYPTTLPMIFHSGDKVLIDGSYIDNGWWKTNYLLVYPELRILFNPLEENNDVKEIMIQITSMFNCEWGVEGYMCSDIAGGSAYATSLTLQPRVKFGFCDGNSYNTKMCDSDDDEYDDVCERYYFFPLIFADYGEIELCEAEFPNDLFKVVTITKDCFSTDPINPPNPINLYEDLEKGVCIETSSSGVGRMRIAGSTTVYIYKDILDIMALVIGGDEMSIFNKNLGRSNYVFKNEVMSRRLALAAKVEYERHKLLWILNKNVDCDPFYAMITEALCSSTDSKTICQLALGDYYDQSTMLDLRTKLDQAESAYRHLRNYGCLNE